MITGFENEGTWFIVKPYSWTPSDEEEWYSIYPISLHLAADLFDTSDTTALS